MADQNFTLTQEYLLSIFDYKDGNLYWKKRNQKQAGCSSGENYRRITLKNKTYREHRLIFLMHHGYLPEFIDHIDGNKSNNLIENLREATHQQNQWNRPVSKNSKTKIKGVCFHKASNRWIAQCSLNSKVNYLGIYITIEEAQKAVENFRFLNHGEFAKS